MPEIDGLAGYLTRHVAYPRYMSQRLRRAKLYRDRNRADPFSHTCLFRARRIETLYRAAYLSAQLSADTFQTDAFVLSFFPFCQRNRKRKTERIGTKATIGACRINIMYSRATRRRSICTVWRARRLEITTTRWLSLGRRNLRPGRESPVRRQVRDTQCSARRQRFQFASATRLSREAA